MKLEIRRTASLASVMEERLCQALGTTAGHDSSMAARASHATAVRFSN
jgi:hypothetical protein